MDTPNLSRCGCFLKCIKTSIPIPLKSLEVEVRVLGVVCDVILSMMFENVEKSPIEAIYEFPLDDESVVYHFQCAIEDRLIVSECQEKKQAKETYDEAISQGHMATLAEQDDSAADIFRCKVGNLMPKAIAKVSMSYACELAFQTNGTFRFTLPTILNARYNPSIKNGGAEKPPLPFLGMTIGQPLPYQFSFIAFAKSNGNMLQISSTRDYYNISYDANSDLTKAELQQASISDHDIHFDISTENPFKPIAFVEKGRNKDASVSLLDNELIMVNFVPKFEDGDRSAMHEIIFLLDRSGSMQGTQMLQARDTLMLMIKSLPSGCRFNIIGFGSDYKCLFKGEELSRVYSAKSLDEASNHAKIVEADLGGTEILEPLKYIYSKPLLTSHARKIILITDGEVYNTHTIIELVKDNSHNTCVFAVGIGDGVSTSLIKGVARAGRGMCEFVKKNDKMQPIVMKLLKAVLQPVVTDLKIDFEIQGVLDLKMIPEKFDPIFEDDRMLVFAFLPTGIHLQHPGKARLSGKVGTRNFHYDVEIPLPLSSIEDNKVLHILAINKEIKRLEDSDKNESNKSSIILLSQAINIVSKYTALVGVDKKKNEVIGGPILQRNVPLMQNHTFPMPQRAMCYSGYSAPMAMYSMDRQTLSGGGDGVIMMDSVPDSVEETLVEEKKVPSYMDFVNLQSYDGSWSPNQELADLLGINIKELTQTDLVKKKPSKDCQAALRTMLCGHG